MSTVKPDSLDVDNQKFKSIMKISSKGSIEQRRDHRSGESDEDSAKTLQLLRIKGFHRLLPEGLT